jgi:hypothetical protein
MRRGLADLTTFTAAAGFSQFSYGFSRLARQAGEVLRLNVCASQPRPPKPASIIAQVEGSGTAVMLIEPSPRFAPAVRAGSVKSLAR